MNRIITVILSASLVLASCAQLPTQQTNIVQSAKLKTLTPTIDIPVSATPTPRRTPMSAPIANKKEDYWPEKSWRESTPEAQGLDSTVLQGIDSRIKKLPPDLHSFLVIRNGYIVFEKYYQGFTPDGLNNIKSCTKSVMSALVGLAIGQGYIEGINQKISRFYPEYLSADTDPEKNEITIENILTMTDGLQWNEGNDAWPWMTSDDPIGFILEKPLASKPGAEWNYSSASAHLLSGIITRAADMSTWDYAKKNLFEPIGITHSGWEQEFGGYYSGAGDICLTPRDMARFGYLYLRKGCWSGNQLIPEGWVEASLSIQNEGYAPKGAYGYLWWIKEMGGYTTCFASGYGGQFIFIVPELDMVIITTASWDKPSSNISYDLVQNYVFPSVVDAR